MSSFPDNTPRGGAFRASANRQRSVNAKPYARREAPPARDENADGSWVRLAASFIAQAGIRSTITNFLSKILPWGFGPAETTPARPSRYITTTTGGTEFATPMATSVRRHRPSVTSTPASALIKRRELIVEKVSEEQVAYDNALDRVPALPLQRSAITSAANVPAIDLNASRKRTQDEMQVDQVPMIAQRPHLTEVRRGSDRDDVQGTRVSAMSPFRVSHTANRPPSRYLQRPPSSSGRVDASLSSRSMLRARSALSSTPRPASETPYGLPIRKKLRWGIFIQAGFISDELPEEPVRPRQPTPELRPVIQTKPVIVMESAAQPVTQSSPEKKEKPATAGGYGLTDDVRNLFGGSDVQATAKIGAVFSAPISEDEGPSVPAKKYLVKSKEVEPVEKPKTPSRPETPADRMSTTPIEEAAVKAPEVAAVEAPKPAETPLQTFPFPAVPSEQKEEETKPSFAFGSTDVSKSAPAEGESKTAEKPSFSFGAPAAVEVKAPESAPTGFSFGAPAAVAVKAPESAPTGFSFGAPAAPTGFAFGAKPEEKKEEVNPPTFGFGTAEKKVEEKPAFSFGAPAEKKEEAKPAFSFGAPAEKKEESKPAFSFGAPSESKAEAKPAFSFGAPSATEKKEEAKPAFTFGASSTEKKPEAPAPAPFSFGSSTTEQKPGFSFGAANPSAKSVTPEPQPMDGDMMMDTPKQERTSSFQFNATAPAAPFSFGAKPAESTEAAPAAPFSFGAKPAETTQAAPAPSGFTFGGASSTSAPAPASGGFTFGGSSAAQSTTSPATTAPFSFGAQSTSAPAPTSTFNFGASSQSTAAPATSGFSFGQQQPQAQPPTAPFGTPSPTTASTFSFGANQQPAASTPAPTFGFGAASTPAQQPPTQSFGFGGAQPPQASGFGAANAAPPAANGFAFGQQQPVQQAQPAGGFAFGNAQDTSFNAPAPAPSGFSFGQQQQQQPTAQPSAPTGGFVMQNQPPAQQPAAAGFSFNFGDAQQAPQTPQGGNLFSMGSSAAPKQPAAVAGRPMAVPRSRRGGRR